MSLPCDRCRLLFCDFVSPLCQLRAGDVARLRPELILTIVEGKDIEEAPSVQQDFWPRNPRKASPTLKQKAKSSYADRKECLKASQKKHKYWRKTDRRQYFKDYYRRMKKRGSEVQLSKI